MRSSFTIRSVVILALCCLLAACQSQKGASPKGVHDSARFASVKSIYIEDLGKEEGADLIENSNAVREEIRNRLAQSGRFSVAESPQESDAILSGLAGFEKWYHGMEGFYGLEGDLDTHFLGVGRLRLIDSKTKQILWSHEYERGFFNLHQTVESRVAEQVVNALLQDAKNVGK